MNGSVALISGAGRGLGLAFAEVLAENGAYVSIPKIGIHFSRTIGVYIVSYKWMMF